MTHSCNGGKDRTYSQEDDTGHELASSDSDDELGTVAAGSLDAPPTEVLDWLKAAIDISHDWARSGFRPNWARANAGEKRARRIIEVRIIAPL